METELQELLAAHVGRLLADGRAGVVRNGYLPEREIQTGLGPITVRLPKVRVKTGEPVTFRSALVPPYVRKTRTLEAALTALAVPEGYLQWRDGSRSGGAGGARGEGPVSQHRVALEAELGAGVSGVAESTPGQGSLGVRVGGRCLQWSEGGTDQALRPGGHRRQ